MIENISLDNKKSPLLKSLSPRYEKSPMVVKISLIQKYPLLLLLFTKFWIEIQIRSRFKIELEIQSSFKKKIAKELLHNYSLRSKKENPEFF